MKVVCDRAALLDAVNLVSGVVPTRSPRPQLTCVKFSAGKDKATGGVGLVTLAATDAEVSVRLSTAQVDVQEEGEVLIPADKLRQIVSAEDGEATLAINAKDDTCEIKSSHSKFKVFGFDVADYPPIPDFPKPDSGADIFAVNGETLERLISRTLFSTARENSRYAINGVLLKRHGKKLEMVATDGRRLALARGTSETPASGDGSSCIIPTKALAMVLKLIDDVNRNVRIAILSNQIVFAFDDDDKGGGTVLASNLVEGTFPPYEDVIPKDQDKKATFEVGTLGSGVRRAALLTNEESRGVRMAFGGKSKGLRLSSRAPEMGEAEVDVDMVAYEGDEIEIGFNPAFIIDALKVVPEEQIIIEMKAPNKPGVIRSGSDFVYVVMPVNLQ